MEGEDSVRFVYNVGKPIPVKYKRVNCSKTNFEDAQSSGPNNCLFDCLSEGFLLSDTGQTLRRKLKEISDRFSVFPRDFIGLQDGQAASSVIMEFFCALTGANICYHAEENSTWVIHTNPSVISTVHVKHLPNHFQLSGSNQESLQNQLERWRRWSDIMDDDQEEEVDEHLHTEKPLEELRNKKEKIKKYEYPLRDVLLNQEIVITQAVNGLVFAVHQYLSDLEFFRSMRSSILERLNPDDDKTFLEDLFESLGVSVRVYEKDEKDPLKMHEVSNHPATNPKICCHLLDLYKEHGVPLFGRANRFVRIADEDYFRLEHISSGTAGVIKWFYKKFGYFEGFANYEKKVIELAQLSKVNISPLSVLYGISEVLSIGILVLEKKKNLVLKAGVDYQVRGSRFLINLNPLETERVCCFLDGNTISIMSVHEERMIQEDTQGPNIRDDVVFPRLSNNSDFRTEGVSDLLTQTIWSREESMYSPEVERNIKLSERPLPTIEKVTHTDRWFLINLQKSGLPADVLEAIPEEVLRVDVSDVTKYPHDFAFQNIVSKTDMSFSKAGLKIGDDNDHKTPDLIIANKNEPHDFFIMEFTTTRAAHKQKLEEALEAKMFKYFEMARERSEQLNKKIQYYMIVASTHHLLTNYEELPVELAKQTMIRLRMAYAVIDALTKKGYEFITSTDYTERQRRAGNILSSFDEKLWSTKYTKEQLQVAQSPILAEDQAYTTNQLVKILKMRNKEIISSVLKQNSRADAALMTEKVIVSYFENYRKKGMEYREDLKSVVRLPAIQAPYDPHTEVLCLQDLKTHLKALDYENMDHIQATWYATLGADTILENVEELKALRQKELMSVFEEKTKEDTLKDMVHGKVTTSKDKRRLYNRLNFIVPADSALESAVLGVDAKRLLKNKLSSEYNYIMSEREKKKMPFSPDVDTQDITEFMQEGYKEMFSQSNLPLRPLPEHLLMKAAVLHGNSNAENHLKMMNFVKWFHGTKLGVMTNILADIGSEVSISLKQNCLNDQYVIKRLKDYPVWILIKPTNLNNKIYFSICWEGDEFCCLFGKVFKGVSVSKNLFMTNWVSYTVAQLVNLCSIDSIMLSVTHFNLELYKIDIFTQILDKTPDQVMINELVTPLRMSLLSLMMSLSDKHQEEEMITLSRYIHMSSMVEFPRHKEPEKIVEKFPECFRSRFEVWLCKRMCKLCLEYSVRDPIGPTKENPHTWSGFLNPFIISGATLQSFPSQDCTINSCYIGYHKNKNQEADESVAYKMCSKILGWEDKMPKTKDFLGLQNPDIETVKPHEFSVSLVKVIAKHTLETIKSKYACDDPKEYIFKECIRMISGEDLETFATYKASSNFGPKWYDHVPLSKQEENALKKTLKKDKSNDAAKLKISLGHYHRDKMLTKVNEKLKDNSITDNATHVFDLLVDALDYVEKNGGLHICLFKKNQHGGLREIYVLDRASRIVQKVIECISKAILGMLPSDTLTHPKNKHNIIEGHYRQSKKNMGGEYMTYCTSDDASKWNQGNYVSKFILLLCQLLPQKLHNLVVRILQCWFEKKIMLPESLISAIHNMNNIESNKDPFYQRIAKAYHGREQVSWMKPGNSFIQTETGMMQGILHYLSSLYHACFLDWLSGVARRLLESKMAKMRLNKTCVVSNAEGSDDSQMMVSVPKTSGEQRMELELAVDAIFDLKEKLGLLLGIYKSTKSTTMTRYMVEYNSDFYFGSQVERATIKWVIAGLKISEADSMIGRQEEMTSARSKILEGGGVISTCYIVNISQALLFYRMNGFTVNVHFDLYSSLIGTCPDPNLGFFLLDPVVASGTLSANYNEYVLIKNSPQLSNRYKVLLTTQIKDRSEKDEETGRSKLMAENTSISLLTRSLIITFGSSKRWERIQEQLIPMDEVTKRLKQDPGLLYRAAENKEEVRVKLTIKHHGPGVVSSLGRFNAASRTLSQSVYVISRPVFYNFAIKSKDNAKASKVSLIKELAQTVSTYDMAVNTDLSNMMYSNFISSFQHVIRLSEKFTMGKASNHGVVKCVLSAIGKNEMANNRNSIIGLAIACTQGMEGQSYEKDQVLAGNILISREALRRLSTLLRVNLVIYHERDENEFHLFTHYTSILNTVTCCFGVDSNEDFVAIEVGPGMDVPCDSGNVLTDEDMSLLFPDHVEYDVLMDNFRDVQLSGTFRGFNFRKKVRAEVTVIQPEQLTKISLERLARFKWFGQGSIAAATSVIDALWSKYKDTIPWLTDDHDETLKKSPFIYAHQLRNYISTLKKKPRKIYLTGSVGKHRFGNMNIMTVVKNNFSNCIRFEESYDKRGKSLSGNRRTIETCCAMIAASPAEKSKKLEYASMCLATSKDLLLNEYDPASKINVLAILQKCVKSLPSLVITYSDPSECIEREAETRRRELNDSKEVFLQNYEMSISKKRQDFVSTKVIDFLDDSQLDFEEDEEVKEREIEEWIEKMKESKQFSEDEAILAHLQITEGSRRDAISKWSQQKADLEYRRELVQIEETYGHMRKNKEVNTEVISYLSGIKHSKEMLKRNREQENVQKSSILELIKSCKLGILGGYEKPQNILLRKGRKTYYGGEGIWTGLLGDTHVTFKLNSYTDSNGLPCPFVVSITINKNRVTEIFKALMKTWFSEHKMYTYNLYENSSYDPSLHGKPMLCNYYDNRFISLKEKVGCPVYYDDTLKYMIGTHEQSFHLEMTDHNIRLLAEYRVIESGSQNLPSSAIVIQYPFIEETITMDIKLPPEMTQALPLWLINWIQFEPYDTSYATDLFKDFPRNVNLAQMDLKVAKMWLRFLWSGTIKRVLPTRYRGLQPTDETDEVEDIVTDFSLDAFLNVDIEAVTKAIEEVTAFLPDLEAGGVEDAIDYEDLTATFEFLSMGNKGLNLKRLCSMHPFLDDWASNFSLISVLKSDREFWVTPEEYSIFYPVLTEMFREHVKIVIKDWRSKGKKKRGSYRHRF
uniref:RNA-directed RNA polymerase L n=1 Tax=Tenuivirus sp. TaxID=2714179 RepID=A0A6M3GUF2_9VIRU|nr:RNA-dependent RNA polymerase [Tenuivirus sp.]